MRTRVFLALFLLLYANGCIESNVRDNNNPKITQPSAVVENASDNNSPKVTQSGSVIEYSHNKHFLKLQAKNPISGEYLIVGGGPVQNLHVDAAFAAIRMEDVKMLVEAYGDFQTCKSQGAFESQKYVAYFLLLPQDQEQANTLIQLAESAKQKYPIIEFTGSEATILEHFMEYNGRNTTFKYAGTEKQILLKSIRILTEDYDPTD